ncbi:MAG: hypothetical protein IT580_05305 [Verrucomicrobiales bacterium]|nr:hypothetical protein [Verrucomicrobiales bacterium]
MKPSTIPIPFLESRRQLHTRQTNPRGTHPTPPESLNLQLARACTREAQLGDQLETWSLLFFGASALALLTGCAFQLEQFVAHWDSFEHFVHAMLG